MSATQIDLDEALLAQAAEILGTTPRDDTVNEALRRLSVVSCDTVTLRSWPPALCPTWPAQTSQLKDGGSRRVMIT